MAPSVHLMFRMGDGPQSWNVLHAGRWIPTKLDDFCWGNVGIHITAPWFASGVSYGHLSNGNPFDPMDCGYQITSVADWGMTTTQHETMNAFLSTRCWSLQLFIGWWILDPISLYKGHHVICEPRQPTHVFCAFQTSRLVFGACQLVNSPEVKSTKDLTGLGTEAGDRLQGISGDFKEHQKLGNSGSIWDDTFQNWN